VPARHRGEQRFAGALDAAQRGEGAEAMKVATVAAVYRQNTDSSQPSLVDFIPQDGPQAGQRVLTVTAENARAIAEQLQAGPAPAIDRA
jgi:hypothetical protein